MCCHGRAAAEGDLQELTLALVVLRRPVDGGGVDQDVVQTVLLRCEDEEAVLVPSRQSAAVTGAPPSGRTDVAVPVSAGRCRRTRRRRHTKSSDRFGCRTRGARGAKGGERGGTRREKRKGGGSFSSRFRWAAGISAANGGHLARGGRRGGPGGARIKRGVAHEQVDSNARREAKRFRVVHPTKLRVAAATFAGARATSSAEIEVALLLP